MDAVGEGRVLLVDDGRTAPDSCYRYLAGAIDSCNAKDDQWNAMFLAIGLYLPLGVGTALCSIGCRI